MDALVVHIDCLLYIDVLHLDFGSGRRGWTLPALGPPVIVELVLGNLEHIMSAFIRVSRYVPACQDFEVKSDSKYCIDGVESKVAWGVNGWRTSSGSEVSNRDLWDDLGGGGGGCRVVPGGDFAVCMFGPTSEKWVMSRLMSLRKRADSRTRVG